MLSSYSLKSHPNKLLKCHLENVGNMSKNIINSKFIDNKELFSNIAYLIGISHDFGKATTFFQKMMITGEKRKYANHGFLSALFGYYVTENYLSKTNQLEIFWYLPVIAWVVINKHHGDIKNIVNDSEIDGEISKLKDSREMEVILMQMKDIVKNNLEELKAIYTELTKELDLQIFIKYLSDKDSATKFAEKIRNDAINIYTKMDIKYYFDILFLYSILLDADKLDASTTSIPPRIEVQKDLIEIYKKRKFGMPKNEIDKAREDAYKEVIASIDTLDIKNERIFSINLPTGLGKTLTGLSFTLKLREKVKEIFGFTPRIIYSLPFLSIIDQNGEVIENVLKTGYGDREIPSNLFLKHHHLADIVYKEEQEGNNEIYLVENINKSLLLTEGWHSEIIITTFVQLFYSIITNRNRAARKFHNIVNSIIILDEIQSIPTKYWLMINKTLTYLSKNFNCWIIFMTATEPIIFEKDREIKSLISNKNKYFKLFDRFRFNFNITEEKSFDVFSSQVIDEIINSKDKNIMIVLNTVDLCKKMYDYIKNKLLIYYKTTEKIDEDGICIFSEMELINLSTYILPSFRLSRINRIKNDNKRKVIITTQLIEAGVDISVDIIYRDIAPLDCLIQTAGRCNRNNENQGIVNVILLKDDKTKRGYWSYIYDSVLINATKEIINKYGKTTTERNFIIHAQDEYYKLVKDIKSQNKEILENLKKLNFSEIVNFKLIEENPKLVPIFIEIDEKAESIRKEIEVILAEKNKFEKRENLLKIKKDINQYTISIQSKGEENNLEPIGNMSDYRYVPRKDLKNWYRLDVGFYIPETAKYFMIT